MTTTPHNFLEMDLIACLAAAAVFSLFALVPGYVTAWLTNFLDFRERGLPARVAVAIPLSIAVTPASAYLAARFLGMGAVWALVWICVAAFVAIAIREAAAHSHALHLPRQSWVFAAIGAAWLAGALLSLVDLQIGHRLYYSVISFDYTTRSAFVSAISRTGVPPANPYFFPGHAETLRYHYFWLIPCSLVNVLGRPLISARQALIGSMLWSGLGVLAVIPLFLRFIHPAGATRLRRRSLIAIGLLAVTGLDLLPNLLRDSLNMPLPDPEWWNSIQVSSWATSMLWEPHHTAAMVAGLMGILICWTLPKDATKKQLAWSIGLSGLAMASCIGSSIYVGLIFGCAIAAWTVFLWLRKARVEAMAACAAGILAVVAVSPHLVDLRGSVTGAPGAGAVISFRIADFVFSNPFRWWIGHSELRLNLVNLFLLPTNYLLELGAFLPAGLYTVRRWRRQGGPWTTYQYATLIFAATSIAICTCFRSAVIANNDLGCRGFLLAQFVLLLWLTDLLEDKNAVTAGQRAILAALMAVGVLGTVHEVVVLRGFTIANDVWNIPRQDWLGADHDLGARTYGLRAGYESLRASLPENAIVQTNPNAIPADVAHGLYVDRQAAAESQSCGVVFGGEPRACKQVISVLDPVFARESTRSDAERACSGLNLSTIVVKDTDPVWANRNSWIWQTGALVSNDFMRALSCTGLRAAGAATAAVQTY